MSRKEALSQFIQQIHGRPVVVKLNSGVDYRGVLACLDGYMNIALEQTEEYVNGQLKNKYGDAFIRGNNVLYISTQKEEFKFDFVNIHFSNLIICLIIVVCLIAETIL